MSAILNGKSIGKDEDEIDLSALYNQILENKWLILAVTSICLVLGFVYISRQPPQYESDVIIQVEENPSSGGNIGGGLAAFNFGGVRANPALIQTALIQSRYILGPVSQALGLDISAKPQQTLWGRHFFPSKAKIWIQILEVPYRDINRPLHLIYDKLNHVKLYNSKKEKLLEGNIDTLLTNADQSIHLQVNKVDAPPGTTFLLNKNSTTQAVAWLSSIKIEDLGKKNATGLLDISFRGSDPAQVVRILNEIAHITVLKNAKKKSLEASKTLDFLHHQLPIVKTSLEAAELELNQYRASSGKIDIKLQAQDFLKQLTDIDKQLAILRLNQIDMQQRYTSEHPLLIALSRQIKEIKQDRKHLESTLKTLPESDQLAVNLIRDVKVKTALYTTLLNKIQELEVLKAGTVSNVQILSLAKFPDSPLPVKKNVTYLVSIFLGLLLSLLIIFGRKLLFPRVQDPHWSERHFNIVNLAIIPYSKEQHAGTHGLTGASKKHIPLLSQTNPRCLSIESLRSLRTSLQVTLSCASNNIISILGVSPGVGKSFVSSNLAYLLATAGKRVLLIDADLRRGTTHKYFNIPPTPGFAELINDSKTADEVLAKESSHKNLTILPRGEYPVDPSELLSSERCKDLLESFSKQFDFVLIDTPPLLLVTDAVLIGAISATNFLVLGSNAHQPAEIEMAIKRLTNSGITVNGSIFNFHNADSRRNPYYYKYYSYNSYYEDSNDGANSSLRCDT